MTKTVTQLTPDKHDEALDLLDRCFETSRVWFETHQKADPNWDISQQLVIEDDQELIGHIWIANREMRYGSGLIPIGGIADVAVRSDHRNGLANLGSHFLRNNRLDPRDVASNPSQL